MEKTQKHFVNKQRLMFALHVLDFNKSFYSIINSRVGMIP